MRKYSFYLKLFQKVFAINEASGLVSKRQPERLNSAHVKLTDDGTRITRKILSRDKESPSHPGEDRGFASRMTRFSSPHAERHVYLQIVRTPSFYCNKHLSSGICRFSQTPIFISSFRMRVSYSCNICFLNTGHLSQIYDLHRLYLVSYLI